MQGIAYKKAGVIVMDIGPACVTQTEMFEQTNPKHELIFKAIDNMHRTIGKDKIKLAAQDLGRTWKMRQERLSPRYTTRFNEIITIKA